MRHPKSMCHLKNLVKTERYNFFKKDIRMIDSLVTHSTFDYVSEFES
jgi:hypothetical protein